MKYGTSRKSTPPLKPHIPIPPSMESVMRMKMAMAFWWKQHELVARISMPFAPDDPRNMKLMPNFYLGSLPLSERLKMWQAFLTRWFTGDYGSKDPSQPWPSSQLRDPFDPRQMSPTQALAAQVQAHPPNLYPRIGGVERITTRRVNEFLPLSTSREVPGPYSGNPYPPAFRFSPKAIQKIRALNQGR